ncbi:hypothetical protein QTP88_010635 [Uroleucon formosanum]
MRPGKLSRHLTTMHPKHQNKTTDFFERKASEQSRQVVFFDKHTHLNNTLLKASFEMTLLIAKAKKSFTIGENLVLPAAIKICEVIHGDKIADTLRPIPVSNDTIKRRIDCMGDHIKSQLLIQIKNSDTFAIQLDESTDLTNNAQLMVFHLTFRKIGCKLNLITNDVVSMVNIVKTRALNTRLFKILCEDMGSNHNTLLIHTDVRWLSRGKVLKRVIELSDELRIFLREFKPDLSALLSNEKWMCLASYLADVFDKVNELNVSLQGQSTNILVLTSKLQAFNKKLSSWLNAFNNGDTSMFTSLHDFLTVNELSLTTSVASVITEHMSSMLQFLYKYFPNLNINNEYNWIKTPFSTSLKYDHIPWAIKEQLIEIREDSTLESEFHEKELSEFWLRRQQEYPLISKAALLILIPFASTYLCETAFSQLQIIKNQHRSCLSQHSLEANLRIAVSNIIPDINMQSTFFLNILV